MNKKFLSALALTFALLFLIGRSSAYAEGVPGIVYVDTSYTGSEDGTEGHPYNTLQEGVAFAQSQPGGAWIYLKQAGAWTKYQYVRPAVSGATGIPLASSVLYLTLVVLAVFLMIVGWQFQHKSHQLQKQ